VEDVARRSHVDVVAEVPLREVADRSRCVCRLAHRGHSQCEAGDGEGGGRRRKVVFVLCLCCVCV
jgi:hypothetical protein